ncbi:proteasome subunit beta type 3 [Guillardia theta CCMP2712]|uniref:Proteasome subunit beta n=1 Tax=Guillardia theta (strain CCMP2712) TaxID=905079 RepID=L1I6D1_GUITC|nr:proteasome subunit beta type 3 [Guillardia theta CCMP2712]EKX31444.1 proteasome subunit beta type 3 [Guillardia theta CCMP2712]|eukprot:XP_005818424.1 proteasome subunit beta type 3 [Guillardia theta CCMP2712]
MSITEYNGGCVIGMAGKNCVAIACDKRYGAQYQTLATDKTKVYKMHDQLFIGLAGLATDQQTFYERLKFRLAMYSLREERLIKPASFGKMVSTLLYEKRFGPYFIEPVIAGLDKENKPYLFSSDFIGAPLLPDMDTNGFVVAGTCTEQLMGMCESMWRKDLEPEELFETVSQCLLAGQDRDCLSGWGAVVHIICPDRVITRTLRGRMD